MGEHGVMAVLHAVRDLEKAAWEAGKVFGGQAMMAAGRQKLQEMADGYNKLDAHNAYLADKLESLIGDKG
jgi:glutamate-1-semialdehyde aminotransferase